MTLYWVDAVGYIMCTSVVVPFRKGERAGVEEGEEVEESAATGGGIEDGACSR